MRKKGIHQVTVPLEVSLGAKDLTLEQAALIQTGSIVELDSCAGEPVEVRLAGETVAFGEVVVIDEKFGVRITGLLSGGSAGEKV